MQEKCDKYKDNRKRPRFHHTAGSKPFHKVQNDLVRPLLFPKKFYLFIQYKCMIDFTNIIQQKKNGVNPDIVETWKETHYSQKGKCWTEGSENVYVSGKHLITYFDYMFLTS